MKIQFDETTKENLVKLSIEMAKLRQTFDVIVATVANMNGVKEWKLVDDLTGIESVEVENGDREEEETR